MSFSSKFDNFGKLTDEIDKFYNTLDINAKKKSAKTQEQKKINEDEKFLIIKLFDGMKKEISKLCEDNIADESEKEIRKNYIEGFSQIFMTKLNETQAIWENREQNQKFVSHFIEIYGKKIEKLTELIGNFEENLKVSVDEKEKKIEESRGKIGKGEENFQISLEILRSKFEVENEISNENYKAGLKQLEKSILEIEHEFEAHEKIWVDEVQKLSAQKLKVEQSYQMILRQFDTDIGGKAVKLNELEEEFNTTKIEYEKWRLGVAEPTKARYEEILAERKLVLAMKSAARKIQKWWRNILIRKRKEKRAMMRKLKKEKLDKKKHKFD